MRVIFNIHSNRAARAAGWRARAVTVNDRAEAPLAEALKAVELGDGSSIYNYIIEEDCPGNGWLLVVDGMPVSDAPSLKRNIKDNVQIHLMDNPRASGH